jgi:hypothetical protein
MRENSSEEFDSAIIGAKQFHDFAQERLRQLRPKSKRDALLLGFVAIALEHQDSIRLLAELGTNDSSALALLRSLSETCLRGMWTHYFATNEEVDQIFKSEFKFDMYSVLQKTVLGKLSRDPEAAALPPHIIGMLHGFTHSGSEQLVFQLLRANQLIPPALGPLAPSVRAASAEILLISEFACLYLGKKELGTQIAKRHQELFPRDPAEREA